MQPTFISHNQVRSFIAKQSFPEESEWPSLLYCLQGQQFNTNLSPEQRTAFADLLAATLQRKKCTTALLRDVFKEKEAILNIPYVKELQSALAETASVLDRFRSISQRRLGDVAHLEKTTLSTVMSGKDPRAMVSELRKAFKAVVEAMEEDSKILEELSVTDQLTGLANRRFFDEYLAQAINETSHKDAVALILLDIDQFKEFNDQYGHLVGDEVLSIVGKIIRETVSACNSKEHKNYLSARYGGEEFAVIMPDCNEEQCLLLAELIRERIEHYPIVIRDNQGNILKKDIQITVSGGYCLMPRKWLTAKQPSEQLIAAADNALYTAKKRGKNMICQCKPYLDQHKKLTQVVL